MLPLLAFAQPDSKPAKQTTPSEPSKSDRNKPAESGKNRSSSTNKTLPRNADITVEREQAALAFAAQHHPELVDLITPLKSSNPKEYQRAIKELFRTSERLASVKARDSARYELELEAWKLQSQIRLLAARLTMAADPELESQLRDTLKMKSENHLKLLQNERETLQSRLAQVDEQISKASQSQEKTVQQEFDRLLKKTAQEKKGSGDQGQSRQASDK